MVEEQSYLPRRRYAKTPIRRPASPARRLPTRLVDPRLARQGDALLNLPPSTLRRDSWLLPLRLSFHRDAPLRSLLEHLRRPRNDLDQSRFAPRQSETPRDQA